MYKTNDKSKKKGLQIYNSAVQQFEEKWKRKLVKTECVLIYY